jgi:3',5'-cyclic AMP phosphodiesterase CpdA
LGSARISGSILRRWRRAASKELNRFLPRPDFVIISGDLVDPPSKEAYDHLLALLSSLEIPFAAVPGNHDDPDLMRPPKLIEFWRFHQRTMLKTRKLLGPIMGLC